MAINKVVYGTTVLVDLTNDTVTASSMLSGTTAHDASGTAITGSMAVQNFYTGATAPASSLGDDGDLYFVTEG